MSARVLAVVGLAVASSCTRISVEAARYTCDPASTDPRQCPGDWRCINDGFCVDPGAGGKWSCSSSAQCTGGWQCVVDGFCADPDEGGRWSCVTTDQCTGGWQCIADGYCVDATIGRDWDCTTSAECTGGWQCVRDGVCANPGAGGSWSCVTSADCTGGWHCGAEGRCYERGDAGAVACRRDAGVEDCAPGWTCGLEGRCLDTGAPSANRCAADGDCFLGWRCADGRCIDPAADALRPGAALPSALAGTSPFLGARVMTGTSWGDGLTVFTGVVGQELVVLQLSDPIVIPAPQRVQLQRLPLGAVDPVELAVLEDGKDDSFSVVAVGRDGGVHAWSSTDAGTLVGATVPLGVPMTGVRRLGQKWLRWGLFGPTHVAFGASLPSLQTTPAPTSAAGAAVDLTSLGEASAHLLLTTPSGTFTLRVDPPGLAPATGWSRTLCPKEAPDRAWRIVRPAYSTSSSSAPTQLLAIAPGDAGDTIVQRFQAGLAGATSLCDLLVVDGSTFGPLEPQSYGFSAAAGVLASANSTRPLGLSGLGPDGGPDLGFFNPSRLREPWGEGLHVSFSNTEQLAAVDPRGIPWLQPPNLYQVDPLTPTAAPRASLGRGWHLVPAPAFRDGPPSSPYDRLCVVTRDTVGCVAARVPQYSEPVRGSDGWVASTPSDPASAAGYHCAVYDELGRPVAGHVVDSRDVPPSGAALAPLPDGGQLLIGRALDYLVAGELALDGGTPVPVALRFAANPLPRGTVTDVLAMPPGTATPPDARYADAWAISSGRVFRVRAPTPTLWRTTEVVLETNEELLRLWRDGARVRGGDRRGVVFGLETRLPLSQPLPNDERVRRYASRCNNDYALSETGRVYHLATGTGPLGRWVEVPLPVRLEALFEGTGPVRGFTSAGASYWLEGDRCATQP